MMMKRMMKTAEPLVSSTVQDHKIGYVRPFHDPLVSSQHLHSKHSWRVDGILNILYI